MAKIISNNRNYLNSFYFGDNYDNTQVNNMKCYLIFFKALTSCSYLKTLYLKGRIWEPCQLLDKIYKSSDDCEYNPFYFLRNLRILKLEKHYFLNNQRLDFFN